MKDPYKIYMSAKLRIDAHNAAWAKAPEPKLTEAENLAQLRLKFADVERVIADDGLAAFYYARDVLKGRWQRAEAAIMGASMAGDYVKDVVKEAVPEWEHLLMTRPRDAYLYALHIIKGRWAVAEPLIITSFFGTPYAKNVIGGRWPEYESYLFSLQHTLVLRPRNTTPFNKCLGSFVSVLERYRIAVINERWPEFEEILIKHAPTHFDIHDEVERYMINVVKGPWPEAESKFLRNKRSRIAAKYMTWAAKASVAALGLPHDGITEDMFKRT